MIATQKNSNLHIAAICSSNMNRSMEAHDFLKKRNYNIDSFGTGTHVKLPGSKFDRPNVYAFGDVSYEEIYQDLCQKDYNLYTQNGMLNMLDRNRRIKERPQKFQNCIKNFDLLFTTEKRIFNIVIETLLARKSNIAHLSHVINIDIQDNHEEATLGAFLICDICEILSDSKDFDDDVERIITMFQNKYTDRNIIYTPITC
ncbi:CTD phosphatase SSU72 [Intoshia linei]|uniref:RNA polymerase II subunit A C-terminal domain phosphatase SSU72 n=1 Tax=Intoshia linei TaxID=1819745 RepID=A0A177ASW8_9BILA|nr:CTD phosphatase SSU72 [Intoshia linei]